MDNRAKWEERVAGWKASGFTSEAYCKGKPFTAGGLRHWAYRLRLDARPAVRLARVVRRPAPRVEDAAPVPAAVLMLECCGMRVVVPPGFDRATLGAVLDVLASRGGA
jgi:hypothetical protein